jgi:hypothetical protein
MKPLPVRTSRRPIEPEGTPGVPERCGHTANGPRGLLTDVRYRSVKFRPSTEMSLEVATPEIYLR